MWNLLPGHAACPVGYDKIGTHCYAYHKDSRQVKNVHNLAKFDHIRQKTDQIRQNIDQIIPKIDQIRPKIDQIIHKLTKLD
jgi:uncharacterized coiled-coil DUF342 family protein